MYARTGLAAYPTDPWYDPQRPNWLPHWIDTPGENAQKWGFYPGADINQVYPAPPMPTPPIVPVGLPENPIDGPSAAAAVQAAIDRRAKLQAQQTAEFFAGVDARLTAAEDARRKESEMSFAVMLGLGALVALVVLPRLLR